MEDARKHLGKSDIAPILLWIWPGVLATASHYFAAIKMDSELASDNDHITYAVKTWLFVADHSYFLILAITIPLLMAAILRLKQPSRITRTIILWILSLPILWYMWECAYLCNKIMTL